MKKTIYVVVLALFAFLMFGCDNVTQAKSEKPTAPKSSTVAPTKSATKSTTTSKNTTESKKTSSTEAPHTHVWDEGSITTPQTCTEKGVMTFTCACGETKTEEIAALGHEYEKVDAVTATYESNGSIEYYECSRCHALALDSEGTQPIDEEDIVVPMIVLVETQVEAPYEVFEDDDLTDQLTASNLTLTLKDSNAGSIQELSVNGNVVEDSLYSLNENELTINGDYFGSKIYGDNVEILVKAQNYHTKFTLKVVTKFIDNLDNLENMFNYLDVKGLGFNNTYGAEKEVCAYDGYLVLTNNIDASSLSMEGLHASWTGSRASVGREVEGFHGIFDGQGFTVSDLTLVSDNVCYGLFGTIGLNGVVKNVAFNNMHIQAGNAVWIQGTIAANLILGTIENVFVSTDSTALATVGYVASGILKNVVAVHAGSYAGALGDMVHIIDFGGQESIKGNSIISNITSFGAIGTPIYLTHVDACINASKEVFYDGSSYTEVRDKEMRGFLYTNYSQDSNFLAMDFASLYDCSENGLWKISAITGYPIFKSIFEPIVVTNNNVYEVYKDDANPVDGLTATDYVYNLGSVDLSNLETVKVGNTILTTEQYTLEDGILTINGSVFGNEIYGDRIEINLSGEDLSYTIINKIVTKIFNTADEFVQMWKYAKQVETDNINSYGDEINLLAFYGYFMLGNDIDATGKTMESPHAGWTGSRASLGREVEGFHGTFDGQGFEVSNLTVGGTTLMAANCNYGIFGTIGENGIVKNAIFRNVAFTSDASAWLFGGLACNVITGSIQNVYFSTSTSINSAIGYVASANLQNLTIYMGGTSNGAIGDLSTVTDWAGVESIQSTTTLSNITSYGSIGVSILHSHLDACINASGAHYYNGATYDNELIAQELHEFVNSAKTETEVYNIYKGN